MKLFGSNEESIAKDKNGRSVFQLEVAEVVIVCRNLAAILCTFTPNKLFRSLIDISFLGNIQILVLPC